MMLQANCAGVSNRVLSLESLKTSQLDALRLIHKYPKLSDCGPKWRSAGSGYVAKMKTVDTPAECHRLSHASWLRGKE